MFTTALRPGCPSRPVVFSGFGCGGFGCGRGQPPLAQAWHGSRRRSAVTPRGARPTQLPAGATPPPARPMTPQPQNSLSPAAPVRQKDYFTRCTQRFSSESQRLSLNCPPPRGANLKVHT
jgi:hypothetical protein